jgi:hypothetical protein
MVGCENELPTGDCHKPPLACGGDLATIGKKPNSISSAEESIVKRKKFNHFLTISSKLSSIL